MKAQNLYDNESFFNNYANFKKSFTLTTKDYPFIKTLLPVISDSKVLDLGCGYGNFCREAISMGAKSVLGVDLSERMISKSKELDDQFDKDNNGIFSKSIKYEIQDLENPNLPENEFDLAYSIFVFHYIDNDVFESLISKVYNSLKKGGTLLFNAEHPFRTCSKVSTMNDVLEFNGNNVWPISHYGFEGIRISNWLTTEGVRKYHRSIGTYINTLIKVGFTISNLTEWSPTQDEINGSPELLIDKQRPFSIIIKAIKN